MSTKEKILARLKAAKNVLSGETLAQELGVSRTAIWKAIKELEKKGYQIQHSANGYRYQPSDILDAKEIHDILMENKFNASIYITVNTLEYLKKGGRITPAAAALGGLLKIKPVLTIQGEKLDSFQKTRTMQKASKIMIEALQKDIKERIDPIHEDMSEAHIMIAYTYDRDLALEFKKEVEEAFPNHEVICDPLSLSVACHIGPHSLAIGACKKI